MHMGKFLTLYRLNQTAYHDLCTKKPPPPGTDLLLWNGLKFCLEDALPKPKLEETFDRLTKDLRTRYFWAQKGDTKDTDYNPKLYIRSTWDPPAASP
jgi:hypothetical protein